MKLKRAQIENFRSVEDSTAFEIDPEITCLVGKNESGKTSLLTALYRLSPIFDTDPKFDHQKDYPRRFLSDYAERHGGEPARVVRTWWTIEDSEKAKIAEVLGPDALKSDEVYIDKNYADKRTWSIKVNDEAVVKFLVDSSDLHNEEKAALGSPQDIEELKTKLAALPDSSPRGAALVEHIDEICPEEEAWRGVHRLLGMPKFLLFSQYQRMQGQVIWLCQNCGKLVDNDADRYTSELLRAWKGKAEASALAEIEGTVGRLPEDAAEIELAVGGIAVGGQRLFRSKKGYDDSGTCIRHDYELAVIVRNLGNERLTGYHVDLEFPTRALETPDRQVSYVTKRSTRTRAFFRASGNAAPELFPGDAEPVMTLPYYVDDDIFGNHHSPEAHTFDEVVRVTLHRTGLAPSRWNTRSKRYRTSRLGRHPRRG